MKREGQLSTSFLTDLTEKAKIFTNFSFIFEKSISDGYLSQINSSFSAIISKEIIFAFTELRSSQAKSVQSFSLHTLIERNTFIFKENLKLLSNLCSSLIS